MIDSSPLLGTKIRVGHTVLAVDGEPVASKDAAISMIHASVGNVSITVGSPSRSPLFKVVAAERSRTNPGINFAPTRGNCLVLVSRVFTQGKFHKSGVVKEGDIVLAVNGVPVSKSGDAFRLLALPAKDNLTVLYVFDLERYRLKLAKHLITSKKIFRDMDMKLACLNGRYRFTCYGQILHRLQVVDMNVDVESQHLYHRDPYSALRVDQWKLQQDYFVTFAGYYKDGVLPFFKALNETLDEDLRSLEDAVCCEAFASHSMDRVVVSAFDSESHVNVPVVEAMPVIDA
jgi:uncharacterized Zn-binding protein involved in type VI secretion